MSKETDGRKGHIRLLDYLYCDSSILRFLSQSLWNNCPGEDGGGKGNDPEFNDGFHGEQMNEEVWEACSWELPGQTHGSGRGPGERSLLQWCLPHTIMSEHSIEHETILPQNTYSPAHEEHRC